LNAVTYLHEKGIVHRDLKAENILITPNHEIKLVDFGTARDMIETHIEGSGTGSKGKKIFKHFVGTPNYMAPECIHNKDSNYKADVYSLGGVVYHLVSGFPPVFGKSEYLIFK